VLRIAATVDPLKVGSPVQVLIGINADLVRIEGIEKQLAEFEEVTFAATITGRLDFVVGAAFRSEIHLREFLAEKLSKIKGVRGIETLHVLNLGKRVWQWAVPPPADRERLKTRRTAGRKSRGVADAGLREPVNGRGPADGLR
jgi:DNA-binding Lrp family transcriptional regulator